MDPSVNIESSCHTCGLRARAGKKPASLLSRIWRWHTKWCPGWKAYMKELKAKGLELPQV